MIATEQIHNPADMSATNPDMHVGNRVLHMVKYHDGSEVVLEVEVVGNYGEEWQCRVVKSWDVGRAAKC